jgi:hypothetical protein
VSSTVGSSTNHRLEAPGKRRILLDVLAIFIKRRRADAVQLAARQRRLQQVGRIHRTISLARAPTSVCISSMNRMIRRWRTGFRQHRLQPFLELAAIFRAGNQRSPCRAPSAACP